MVAVKAASPRNSSPRSASPVPAAAPPKQQSAPPSPKPQVTPEVFEPTASFTSATLRTKDIVLGKLDGMVFPSLDDVRAIVKKIGKCTQSPVEGARDSPLPPINKADAEVFYDSLQQYKHSVDAVRAVLVALVDDPPTSEVDHTLIFNECAVATKQSLWFLPRIEAALAAVNGAPPTLPTRALHTPLGELLGQVAADAAAIKRDGKDLEKLSASIADAAGRKPLGLVASACEFRDAFASVCNRTFIECEITAPEFDKVALPLTLFCTLKHYGVLADLPAIGEESPRLLDVRLIARVNTAAEAWALDALNWWARTVSSNSVLELRRISSDAWSQFSANWHALSTLAEMSSRYPKKAEPWGKHFVQVCAAIEKSVQRFQKRCVSTKTMPELSRFLVWARTIALMSRIPAVAEIVMNGARKALHDTSVASLSPWAHTTAIPVTVTKHLFHDMTAEGGFTHSQQKQLAEADPYDNHLRKLVFDSEEFAMAFTTENCEEEWKFLLQKSIADVATHAENVMKHCCPELVTDYVNSVCTAFFVFEAKQFFTPQTPQDFRFVSLNATQIHALKSLLAPGSGHTLADVISCNDTTPSSEYSQILHLHSGQGKTLVLSMAAVCFALLGVEVDVLCDTQLHCEAFEARCDPVARHCFHLGSGKAIAKAAAATTMVRKDSKANMMSRWGSGNITCNSIERLLTDALASYCAPIEHVINRQTDSDVSPTEQRQKRILLADEVDVLLSRYCLGGSGSMVFNLRSPTIESLLSLKPGAPFPQDDVTTLAGRIGQELQQIDSVDDLEPNLWQYLQRCVTRFQRIHTAPHGPHDEPLDDRVLNKETCFAMCMGRLLLSELPRHRHRALLGVSSTISQSKELERDSLHTVFGIQNFNYLGSFVREGQSSDSAFDMGRTASNASDLRSSSYTGKLGDTSVAYAGSFRNGVQENGNASFTPQSGRSLTPSHSPAPPARMPSHSTSVTETATKEAMLAEVRAIVDDLLTPNQAAHQRVVVFVLTDRHAAETQRWVSPGAPIILTTTPFAEFQAAVSSEASVLIVSRQCSRGLDLCTEQHSEAHCVFTYPVAGTEAAQFHGRAVLAGKDVTVHEVYVKHDLDEEARKQKMISRGGFRAERIRQHKINVAAVDALLTATAFKTREDHIAAVVQHATKMMFPRVSFIVAVERSTDPAWLASAVRAVETGALRSLVTRLDVALQPSLSQLCVYCYAHDAAGAYEEVDVLSDSVQALRQSHPTGELGPRDDASAVGWPGAADTNTTPTSCGEVLHNLAEHARERHRADNQKVLLLIRASDVAPLEYAALGDLTDVAIRHVHTIHFSTEKNGFTASAAAAKGYLKEHEIANTTHVCDDEVTLTKILSRAVESSLFVDFGTALAEL